MSNCLSGGIEQIGIVLAPFSANSQNHRVCIQWRELAAIGNKFQLSHKIHAPKFMQQGKHLRYIIVLSHLYKKVDM